MLRLLSTQGMRCSFELKEADLRLTCEQRAEQHAHVQRLPAGQAAEALLHELPAAGSPGSQPAST